MLEWPQERVRRQIAGGKRILPPVEAKIALIRASKSYQSVYKMLEKGAPRSVRPDARLYELQLALTRSVAASSEVDANWHTILAVAAADVLRTAPNSKTWARLYALTRESNEFEHAFADAVSGLCEDGEFLTAFVDLARGVIGQSMADVTGVGPSAIDYHNAARANWQERKRLSSLWFNHFRDHFGSGLHQIDVIFRIVAERSLSAFFELLQVVDYPDLVAHVLSWSGAMWRFETWKSMVATAPPAFDSAGGWTGNLVLPLLLSIGVEQARPVVPSNASADVIEKATAEIKDIAGAMVSAVMGRPDTAGTVTRWSTWLTRQMLQLMSADPIPYPTNAASGGFLQSSILDALADGVGTEIWLSKLFIDAEEWEPWCHLTAGILFAHSNKATMPSLEAFRGEWALTLEDWVSDHGKRLKLRAQPFEFGNPKADGYGARILSVAAAGERRPDEAFRLFWNSSWVLREIVEFGSADEDDAGKWQARSDAGRLLMVQFSIGLMTWDMYQDTGGLLNPDGFDRMQSLLETLRWAAKEMSEIDGFNSKYWNEAVRHLAIRSARFSAGRTDPNDKLPFGRLFEPSFSTFVADLAGDTENLLSLILIASLNGISTRQIIEAFTEAKVDIEREIHIAERLSALSHSKSIVNPELIAAARKLRDFEGEGNSAP